MFNFTIDGHTMTVVEADGVYTVATEVDLLSIYSSQRCKFKKKLKYCLTYDLNQNLDAVIVTASHSAGNFWMRATSDPTYWNDLKFEESGFNPDIRAIWRVGRAPDVDPESKSVIATVLDPYILGELGGTMKMDLPTVFDKDINM
jgi:iron transport multicopper oxidase